MLTRKTQYAWMAMGGLICLFGLVLACKLRDGNKAIAQVDKPPILLGSEEDKAPTLPPPIKPTTGPSLFPLEPDKALPPKIDTHKLAADKPKEKSEPKSLPELPSLTPPPMTKPSAAKAPPAPVSGPILPASFTPNASAKEPDGFQPTPQLKPPVSSSSPPSRNMKESVRPPQLSGSLLPDGPSSTTPPEPLPPPKVSPRDAPPPPSFPFGSQLSPTSYAPATAAPPSSEHSDREAKSQPGEPPLAPAPGPVQIYHAHGSETLQDIARRTLGNAERWTDVHKLNPALKPDTAVAAGTVVRLPGDACVQADEVEPVKPLPALRPKPSPPKARVLPLTGTYQCSLDEKGQLTLPRSIRDQFGGSETVLISPGPDKCLWITNQAHLERLGERLEQSQANEADVRVFKRLYFAQTEKLSVNGDGRVAIPERLAQFAGLHQELVLVGIDDHFEVWDAARWRQYTQQKGGAAGPAAVVAE